MTLPLQCAGPYKQFNMSSGQFVVQVTFVPWVTVIVRLYCNSDGYVICILYALPLCKGYSNLQVPVLVVSKTKQHVIGCLLFLTKQEGAYT